MISFIDIALALVLGFALWKGWKNGFVYEVVMFLALFAAIYIAINFSDWTASFLTNKMEMKAASLPVVSFGITFLLVMVGAWFLAKLVGGLTNSGGAETPNRIGGAILSLGKAVFILSIAFLFLVSADKKYGWLSQEQREKSWLLGPVYNFSLNILPAIEDSDFFKRIRESNLDLASDTAKVSVSE